MFFRYRVFDTDPARQYMGNVVNIDTDKELVSYDFGGQLWYQDFSKVVFMPYIEAEDTDGTEIAEGDIMQHRARPEFSGIVRFAKGGFFCVGKTKTDDRKEVWSGSFMEHHCVIRGNAYQNPELMDWFQPEPPKQLPGGQGRVRVNHKVIEGEVVTDKDVVKPKKRGTK